MGPVAAPLLRRPGRRRAIERSASNLLEPILMPEHKFTYPRVVPVPPKGPAPDPVAPDAPKPLSQRELVAASLVRCPPRDGDPPRRG